MNATSHKLTVAAILFGGLACIALTSCTSAQIAGTEATVSKYQSDVASACAIASTAAGDPAAVLLSASVPDVAQAIDLVKASCGSEEAIANLVLSPTSVSWLGTLTQTIHSKGTVVPPPPVAPAAVVGS